MELSGIELHYLVNKISSTVPSEFYVSNISSITKNSILLKLHHPIQPDIMLMVSTEGIWITNKKYKQVEETQFVSVISREIERAKITSVSQPGSERIYFLHFVGRDDKVRILIVEIFGKGNFVLCDESMKMIWILNSVEVRHRTLKIGSQYALPPSRGEDVLKITLESMTKNLSQVPENIEVLKWLGKSTSLPRKYVEQIISESEINTKFANQLSNKEIEIIYEKTKELTDRILDEKNHEPSVTIDDSGVAIDASPISMSKESNSKKVETFMEAIDQVLSNEILSIGRSLKTEESDRIILELEHDLEEQNKAKMNVLLRSKSLRSV
ncbi:MAG TPA: NFACT family protein, partial [Nitrososphaeraceae archaeon]|nr:NFACT family protein [Nitrososphaeraceae archaeon]